MFFVETDERHKRVVDRIERQGLRGDEHGQQPVDLGQQLHPPLRPLLYYGPLRTDPQGHPEGQKGCSGTAQTGCKHPALQLSARGCETAQFVSKSFG